MKYQRTDITMTVRAAGKRPLQGMVITRSGAADRIINAQGNAPVLDALPISSAIPATERSARAEYMGRQMNVFAQVGRAVGSTCASQPAPLACQQPSLVIGHWSLVIRYALLL